MENFVFYEPLRQLREIVGSGGIGEPVGFAMKMVGTGLGGWDVPLDTWQWQIGHGQGRARDPHVRRRVAQVRGGDVAVRPGSTR